MKNEKVKIINTCRLCGNKNLAPILSLGSLFVSDFVDSKNIPPSVSGNMKAPLELVLCSQSEDGCGLLQLGHTVSHEALYRNYWYRSGMNQTMTEELHGIARKVEEIRPLRAGDYIIDIGANDGTLFRGYKTTGLNLIGFEPARNLLKWNSVGATRIINDFFNHAAWEKEFPKKRAKALTAIAMFYDLDDQNLFVADVAKCLDEEGVFIIQMSYLPLMLAQNAFDNAVHEHVEYYSLLALENLLKRHDLEVFDVELNDVNGGSFRIYIRHTQGGKTLQVPSTARNRINNLRAYEKKIGLGQKKVYEDFVRRVEAIKKKTTDFIIGEVAKGKTVYVYGASTKGNTLLQYFGLDHKLITAAAERNPDKWGKKTVGTNIPIISEEDARQAKPDYFLILPWHFLAEFIGREKEFLASGGKFIVPLPEFRVISHEDPVEDKFSPEEVLSKLY